MEIILFRNTRRLAEEPITLNELADEFGVSRVRVREGAENGEEPRRRDENSGASASALASNPFPWVGETADGRIAMGAFTATG